MKYLLYSGSNCVYCFLNSALIKTLQQNQKCLEFKETKILSASSPWQNEKLSDSHQSVSLEQTSDTLSYDSKDPLLSSVKPQCLSHSEQMWVTQVKSCTSKPVKFHATLTGNNPAIEHSNESNIIQGSQLLSMTSSGVKETAVKPVMKTSKGSGKSSRSKNRKTAVPFIEHQEDKRTSFSRANFVTLQERLSADEMHILSQLARALSLPDDVRRSLDAYLDRQRALHDSEHVSNVDEQPSHGSDAGDYAETAPAAKSKKRKKGVKKESVSRERDFASTSSKPFWNAEDVNDPERLKMLLEQAAKLLHGDKQLLLESAIERDRLMKENAYHDKMASFVELCINTGMVSMDKMNIPQLFYNFVIIFFKML